MHPASTCRYWHFSEPCRTQSLLPGHVACVPCRWSRTHPRLPPIPSRHCTENLKPDLAGSPNLTPDSPAHQLHQQQPQSRTAVRFPAARGAPPLPLASLAPTQIPAKSAPRAAPVFRWMSMPTQLCPGVTNDHLHAASPASPASSVTQTLELHRTAQCSAVQCSAVHCEDC